MFLFDRNNYYKHNKLCTQRGVMWLQLNVIDADVNECASSPCFNRGTCVDDINSYTCRCLPGFIDVHCETSWNCICKQHKSILYFMSFGSRANEDEQNINKKAISLILQCSFYLCFFRLKSTSVVGEHFLHLEVQTMTCEFSNRSVW